MLLRNGDQLYLSVEAAVEGEVRLLGVNTVVVFIADRDGKYIFVPKLSCQFDAEGAVASLMQAEHLAVQVDSAGVRRAAKLKKECLALRLLFVQLANVPAGSAVVIVAAVLSVDRIPGVGEGNNLSRPGVLCSLFCRSSCLYKLPSVCKCGYSAHLIFSLHYLLLPSPGPADTIIP